MKIYVYIIITLLLVQSLSAKNSYKDQSVLATGNWIKVAANNSGIYKITYDQLKNWGISSPEKVGVFTNGGYMLPLMNNVENYDDLEKIPVLHAKDGNNNDAIFFYSTGTVEWKYDSKNDFFKQKVNLFDDKVYFYITSDLQKSNEPDLKEKPSEEPETTLSNYIAYQFYEEEEININKTGRRWYSNEISTISPFTKSFSINNINSGNDARIEIRGATRSSTSSKHIIKANNSPIGNIVYSATSYALEIPNQTKIFQVPASAKQNISITFENEGSNGKSWLDYITINQLCNITLDNGQLSFRNPNATKYNIVSYKVQNSTNSTIVWDITNPLVPIKLNYNLSSGTLTFNDHGKELKEYIAFKPESNDIPTPSFIENVANQNIHGLPIYDMVIVSHPNFISQSETLAEYHRQNDNLKILVVSTIDIYNEFSSGIKDVSAIRNMMRMFYDRRTATDSVRYLLLMGDGSYNNKGLEENFYNYIPTWQNDDPYEDSSFISDDFFGLLDENEGESKGKIDIGIGRIPCRIEEEAEIVVNKIINYQAPENMGEWRNVLTMIADDEDNKQYMTETEELIDTIKNNYSGFFIDKIYFDAFPQINSSGSDYYPDATKAINQRVADGTLILNYIGHANPRNIAHENVLGISDINSWGNKNKLPIFVTATCEFSRFDDNQTSAGEYILFNPAGGGIALFSTTRPVYAYANRELSINFYHYAFKQDSYGNNLRLGDIMMLAKRATINSPTANKRSFALLGDPALRLAFPKYDVKTKRINSVELVDTLVRLYTQYEPILTVKDTVNVGALDKVTIESEVQDRQGNLLEDFNGQVTTIVYDKSIKVQTLDNDGIGAFKYESQNNIIYKGVSTVTNGKFTVQFIVPKDISYNIDMGKILYYATNETEDANGESNMFAIGGSSPNPFVENDPPEMDIYLNNDRFRNHDKVASSSLLLVELFDESGINTVGTGIGHDMVAILDDNYSNPMILNDFYSAKLDNYQKGTVIYPLNNLDPGEHTLSVKVWDIQNNSITKEISFIVEEGFKVTSVTNYPNPVNFETTFNISHNLPGNVFEVKLELFNLRGIKIYEINDNTGSDGTVTATVRWDISQTYYPIDNEKILIYRVTLKNQKGLKAVGSGKLLLNKY